MMFRKAVSVWPIKCLAICVVVATASQAIADAVIGTYAQNGIMVADGTTVYTAWIYADNTGLNGELTWGAQYQFFLPPYATPVPGGLGVAYGKPDTARDFFEGKPMVFEVISGPTVISGRLVNQADQVSNKVGDLQFYRFTINPGAPVGVGNFDLGPSTVLTGSLGSPQPFTKQNNQFSITALAGDFNLDGFVGVDDLNLVLANWNATAAFPDYPTGDFNADRFVGVDDLNWVLNNWNTGSPPIGSVVPEPGMTVLLLIGSLTLLRRSGSPVSVDTGQ
jgi:hypothetical protein